MSLSNSGMQQPTSKNSMIKERQKFVVFKQRSTPTSEVNPDKVIVRLLDRLSLLISAAVFCGSFGRYEVNTGLGTLFEILLMW